MMHSMMIAALDFPCLWGEAVIISAYLKTRVPHKCLPLSTISLEHFHVNRPTISHLQLFGSKCSVHNPGEEHSSRWIHLSRTRKTIHVSCTSSPKGYRGFTLEDEYLFTSWDLTFPKQTSPQVATTLRKISQDPEPDS
jgi:hypothetical protein